MRSVPWLILSIALAGCGTSVQTSSGEVVGYPASGATHFLGIPYAEPPLGDLRFRAPVEHAPWKDPLSAAKIGDKCPQGGSNGESEDCLFLNVWTPRAAKGGKLPVMFFIHGGAFVGGSGGENIYDGAYLAQKGQVVVVTINYRLGPFGFFAHPALEDEHMSAGNYGLLDQQLALRWVQKNIDAFGGDPANVTIFGESAGSFSVCAQLVSPLSDGLFAKAIGESGSCLLTRMPLRDEAGQPESAEALGRRVATNLGCDTAPDVGKCLRSKSYEDFKTANPDQSLLDLSAARFTPNLDGHVLPKNIATALRGGAFQKVPFLSGINKDEGTLFTINTEVKTRADFEAFVRSALPHHGDEGIALYPEAKYPKVKDALDAFVGDVAFVCPVRLQSRLVASVQPKAWLYLFTRNTYVGQLLGLGVAHATELLYVFHNFVFPFADNEEERAISDTIIGYWTRFAATGDPNGPGAVTWPAVTAASDYLELDKAQKAGAHLSATPCDTIEPWLDNP